MPNWRDNGEEGDCDADEGEDCDEDRSVCFLWETEDIDKFLSAKSFFQEIVMFHDTKELNGKHDFVDRGVSDGS